MLPAPFTAALVLTGPTGSGKSALALERAAGLDAEIVSMDSMALYRGMDIGTAKPTWEEQAAVRHHLLDVLDPSASASVAWWLGRAGEACRDIAARGKRPLFVGGTPLYLKALLHGLFDGPPADAALRERLAREAEAVGAVELHRRLAAVDAPSAARLHPNDLRRVVRALEVHELTGRPISTWQTQWTAASVPETPALCWLDLPRAELYDRIDRRVRAMFAAGLVAEVEGLMQRPMSREAGQALGYKEVIAHLESRLSLAETLSLVQTRSRQLAKRQITWFRHLPGLRPVAKELTPALWRDTITPG